MTIRCLATSPALGPSTSRLYPLRCSVGRLHKEVFMYISCSARHYHYRDKGAKQIIITLDCPVKFRLEWYCRETTSLIMSSPQIDVADPCRLPPYMHLRGSTGEGWSASSHRSALLLLHGDSHTQLSRTRKLVVVGFQHVPFACQLHSVHLGARLELRLCAFGNVWSEPQLIWPADLAVVKAGKKARKMAETTDVSGAKRLLFYMFRLLGKFVVRR